MIGDVSVLASINSSASNTDISLSTVPTIAWLLFLFVKSAKHIALIKVFKLTLSQEGFQADADKMSLSVDQVREPTNHSATSKYNYLLLSIIRYISRRIWRI